MKLLNKKSILFYVFICNFFFLKAQEADTSAHDLFSEGFKAHAFVMNMTDVAKVTGLKKPYLLSVSGAQFTLFTKENKWWKGGMFSIYALNTFGDNPTSDDVHDIQMFDNIESFPDPDNHIDFKNGGQLNYRTFIYNLYYQHFFKKARILVGQYDLNYDFAFSNTGLNFLNSSFGVQPNIAYNVPTFSTFPFTNLTTRLEYNISEKWNFRFAVSQAYGGNLGGGEAMQNVHGTKYINNFKDGGAFFISEISRTNLKNDVLFSDYKLGFWSHTGSKSLKFPNRTDLSDTKDNHFNYGAYLIADKLLYAEKSDSAQGLQAFIDLGWTPGDYNFFNYYAGGGFSYTGLLPKRGNDIVSLAIANPFISKGLQDSGLSTTEKAIEFNYNFVTEHVNIQPCVQYLVNIGGLQNDNKAVFMIRFTTHNGVFY
jgi:carbohydrate-selective porin OprB